MTTILPTPKSLYTLANRLASRGESEIAHAATIATQRFPSPKAATDVPPMRDERAMYQWAVAQDFSRIPDEPTLQRMYTAISDSRRTTLRIPHRMAIPELTEQLKTDNAHLRNLRRVAKSKQWRVLPWVSATFAPDDVEPGDVVEVEYRNPDTSEHELVTDVGTVERVGMNGARVAYWTQVKTTNALLPLSRANIKKVLKREVNHDE